jgi:hypothetical protein
MILLQILSCLFGQHLKQSFDFFFVKGEGQDLKAAFLAWDPFYEEGLLLG